MESTIIHRTYDAKLFVKVKNWHFRRANCLDSVALDILMLGVIYIDRRKILRYSSCSVFVWFAKVIAAWKFSAPSAFGTRSIEPLLLIADEHWSRRYTETALAVFSCFANWLVTLFSALYCVNTAFVVTWIVTRISRPVSNRFGQKVMETVPPGKGSRSNLPSELGFALRPGKPIRHA